ncbi:MAG: Na+/H+ antiporter NhaA [Vulcanibacillus sp.]
MRRRINLLREFSVPLIAGVVVALIWANLDHDSYHAFVHTEFFAGLNFHFLVQDIFMAFFFAIAAVEITQSFSPGGDLNPIKKAVNPLIATVGGVLGPITVFLILNSLIGSPVYTNGWAIPTATDIALAWLVAKFVFGEKHPAVSFLLLLAIADDAIGLIIIAIFYPDPLQPFEPMWLLVILAGVILAFIFRKLNIRNYWPYLILAGGLSWIGFHNAHLHPSLSLVVIIPFLPNGKRAIGHLFEDVKNDKSTLVKFEHDWKKFVDVGLFFFGIANAGVEFSEVGNLTWIVLASLLVGKTVGIYTFSSISEKLGFPLPSAMGKKELFLAGVVAAMGLTVALFVADVAYTDVQIQGSAKMGALFSSVVFILAFIVSKTLRIKKYK